MVSNSISTCNSRKIPRIKGWCCLLQKLLSNWMNLVTVNYSVKSKRMHDDDDDGI